MTDDVKPWVFGGALALVLSLGGWLLLGERDEPEEQAPAAEQAAPGVDAPEPTLVAAASPSPRQPMADLQPTPELAGNPEPGGEDPVAAPDGELHPPSGELMFFELADVAAEDLPAELRNDPRVTGLRDYEKLTVIEGTFAIATRSEAGDESVPAHVVLLEQPPEPPTPEELEPTRRVPNQ